MQRKPSAKPQEFCGCHWYPRCQFHSNGPLNLEEHYGVARADLVGQCIRQLAENGHYLTIWSPGNVAKEADPRWP